MESDEAGGVSVALLGGQVRGKGEGVRTDPTCVPELLEGPAQVQVHQARRVSPCWARPLLRLQTLSGVKPLTVGLLTAVCTVLRPISHDIFIGSHVVT